MTVRLTDFCRTSRTLPPSCEVRGAMFRARSRVPLGSVRHLTGVIRRWSFQERPHLAVQRPFACSGVKALRNTSDAKAASRQSALAFRSLDPFCALREPDRRRRDEKRPFPFRTKNCQQTQTNNQRIDCPATEGKAPLTGKAPYKSGANPSIASFSAM